MFNLKKLQFYDLLAQEPLTKNKSGYEPGSVTGKKQEDSDPDPQKRWILN
jgi:hypothetical protein